MLIDQSGASKGELVTRRAQEHPDRPRGSGAWPTRKSRPFAGSIARSSKTDSPRSEIADNLNARGHRYRPRARWTRGTVHQVLINEKYIGNNVWNRISFKLKKKRVRNSPDMWIRADGVFEPIVDRLCSMLRR